MIIKTFPSVLVCLLTIGCGNSRNWNNIKNLPGEDPTAAALPGQGFSTVDGTIKGHCVELGSIVTQSGQATGSTAEYRLLEINSESSLRENLNISAAASIRGAIYGGGGRTNFVSSVNKNASSRYVLVHAKVANQMELANSFSFKPEAIALLKRGKMRDFVEQCGNEFVYGRRTGGEFYALFEYDFSSSEEEKRFSAAINASGAGWKASSNINRDLAKFNMSASVQVKMFRLGGSGSLPEIENLSDYSRKFPEIVSAVQGSPVTLELITKDYSGVTPLDHAPNPALIERQKFIVSSIAKSRDEAAEKIATIRYIKQHPDDFELHDLDQLSKADADLISFINVQNSAAVACFENIWTGCSLPNLNFPIVSIPNRKWDASNRCPVSYAWDSQNNACCRNEPKVSCEVTDAAGSCVILGSKNDKVCL